MESNDNKYLCINMDGRNICFFKEDINLLFKMTIYLSLWSGGVILVDYLQNIRVGILGIEFFWVYMTGFLFLFSLMLFLFLGAIESIIFPLSWVNERYSLTLKRDDGSILYKGLSIVLVLIVMLLGYWLNCDPDFIAWMTIAVIFVWPIVYASYILIKSKSLFKCFSESEGRTIHKIFTQSNRCGVAGRVFGFLYGHYFISSISSVFVFIVIFPLAISFDLRSVFYFVLLFVIILVYILIMKSGGFFIKYGDPYHKSVHINKFNIVFMFALVFWLPVFMPFDNKRNILSLVSLSEKKGQIYAIATANGEFMLGEVLLKTAAGIAMCYKNRLMFISSSQVTYFVKLGKFDKDNKKHLEKHRCDLF